jgi:hypothetical protein
MPRLPGGLGVLWFGLGSVRRGNIGLLPLFIITCYVPITLSGIHQFSRTGETLKNGCMPFLRPQTMMWK